MLFNSYEFVLLFLPITFWVYFYFNKRRLTEASKGVLVVSSLFFYSWWNVAYLPLMLFSLVFNYVIGTSLTKDSEHKNVSKNNILAFGIVGNVGLLAYFKYTDFLISNVNILLNEKLPLPEIVLPLAISFFTFQQIAYLVDSYKGNTKEYDFLNYTIFVSFFPQLIAGPIVHHKEMMPQFSNLRNKAVNYKNVTLGLFIFAIGLFKKVGIADTFGVWASSGFDNSEALGLFDAWATSLSYTLQLYFDFSGYTDMAVGAALLFNIKLPINFNSPYKSTNIQDFWNRWHITLSRFLKEYIYIPLGGNRKGNFRLYNNLLITFLIGGLWHGAGWTFVFWGLVHGAAIVVHRIWNQLGGRMNSAIGWFVTFNFVNISWVFFRAKEWKDAIKVLSGMIGLNGIDGDINVIQYGLLILATVVVVFFKNSNSYRNGFNYTLIKAIIVGILFFVSFTVLEIRSSSEFLYFQF